MTAPFDGKSVAALVEDPYPFYRRWHEESPVVRVPGLDVFFVTTWDLVSEAAGRPEDFSNNVRRLLYTGDDGSLSVLDLPDEYAMDVLGAADPPAHSVHRRVVSSELVQREMSRVEPFVAHVVDDLLRAAQGQPRMEATRALSTPLPMKVIGWLIGFRDVEVDQLAAWAFASARPGSVTITLADIAEAGRVTADLGPFLVDQLEASISAPGDGILGAVARGIRRGVINRHEALQTLGILLSAGGETTTSLIGNAIRILAEQPALQSDLRREPRLVPAFLEEVLRLESPFRFHQRLATQDTELGGVPIPTRSLVMLMWGAANRDPVVWDDADELRLNRSQGRSHMGFGRGIHFCLGAPLARLEARIAITELLARTDFFELDPADAPRWLYSLWFRRHDHLPITVAW